MCLTSTSLIFRAATQGHDCGRPTRVKSLRRGAAWGGVGGVNQAVRNVRGGTKPASENVIASRNNTHVDASDPYCASCQVLFSSISEIKCGKSRFPTQEPCQTCSC